jgi:hypothetical protein
MLTGKEYTNAKNRKQYFFILLIFENELFDAQNG